MLKKAQQKLQEQPLNNIFQTVKRETYAKFKQSSYLAELNLQQQSKVKWLKLGNDNNRYFFSMIKHRRFMSATTKLRDIQGQWKTDPESIAQIIVNYYKKHLGEKAKIK